MEYMVCVLLLKIISAKSLIPQHVNIFIYLPSFLCYSYRDTGLLTNEFSVTV